MLLLTLFITDILFAQQDSIKEIPKALSHRDSIYLAKMNTTSNLMIAGGIGLCGAGTYLIWEGTQIYKTPAGPTSTNPSGDVARNHQQGSIYMVAGGASIAAGVILGAFGVKRKIEFKQRKQRLLAQAGLLDNGHLGACLGF